MTQSLDELADGDEVVIIAAGEAPPASSPPPSPRSPAGGFGAPAAALPPVPPQLAVSGTVALRQVPPGPKQQPAPEEVPEPEQGQPASQQQQPGPPAAEPPRPVAAEVPQAASPARPASPPRAPPAVKPAAKKRGGKKGKKAEKRGPEKVFVPLSVPQSELRVEAEEGDADGGAEGEQEKRWSRVKPFVRSMRAIRLLQDTLDDDLSPEASEDEAAESAGQTDVTLALRPAGAEEMESSVPWRELRYRAGALPSMCAARLFKHVRALFGHAPRDRKLMVALAEVRCAWDGRVRGFEHRALSLTQRGPALEARLRCLTPAGASAWREEGVRLSAERYWQLRMTHPNAATRGACGLWEAAVRAASESSLAGGGIDKASLKVVVEAAASNSHTSVRLAASAATAAAWWLSHFGEGAAALLQSDILPRVLDELPAVIDAEGWQSPSLEPSEGNVGTPAPRESVQQRMLARLQKVHRETAERLERCIPTVARAVVQDIVRYDTLSRNMLSLVAALALAVDFRFKDGSSLTSAFPPLRQSWKPDAEGDLRGGIIPNTRAECKELWDKLHGAMLGNIFSKMRRALGNLIEVFDQGDLSILRESETSAKLAQRILLTEISREETERLGARWLSIYDFLHTALLYRTQAYRLRMVRSLHPDDMLMDEHDGIEQMEGEDEEEEEDEEQKRLKLPDDPAPPDCALALPPRALLSVGLVCALMTREGGPETVFAALEDVDDESPWEALIQAGEYCAGRAARGDELAASLVTHVVLALTQLLSRAHGKAVGAFCRAGGLAHLLPLMQSPEPAARKCATACLGWVGRHAEGRACLASSGLAVAMLGATKDMLIADSRALAAGADAENFLTAYEWGEGDSGAEEAACALWTCAAVAGDVVNRERLRRTSLENRGRDDGKAPQPPAEAPLFREAKGADEIDDLLEELSLDAGAAPASPLEEDEYVSDAAFGTAVLWPSTPRSPSPTLRVIMPENEGALGGGEPLLESPNTAHEGAQRALAATIMSADAASQAIAAISAAAERGDVSESVAAGAGTLAHAAAVVYAALATDEHIASELIDTGVTGGLFRLMQSQDVGARAYAAATLGLLASHPPEGSIAESHDGMTGRYRHALLADGALDVLLGLACSRDAARNADLQDTATAVAMLLATEAGAGVSDEALDSLVAALRVAEGGTSRALTFLAAAMWCLARNPTNRQRLGECGAVRALIDSACAAIDALEARAADEAEEAQRRRDEMDDPEDAVEDGLASAVFATDEEVDLFTWVMGALWLLAKESANLPHFGAAPEELAAMADGGIQPDTDDAGAHEALSRGLALVLRACELPTVLAGFDRPAYLALMLLQDLVQDPELFADVVAQRGGHRLRAVVRGGAEGALAPRVRETSEIAFIELCLAAVARKMGSTAAGAAGVSMQHAATVVVGMLTDAGGDAHRLEMGARGCAIVSMHSKTEVLEAGGATALIRLVREQESDVLTTLACQALLNLSSSAPCQVAIGRQALRLMLRLNQDRSSPLEVVRCTSGILANCAKHRQNRTRFYRAELDQKAAAEGLKKSPAARRLPSADKVKRSFLHRATKGSPRRARAAPREESVMLVDVTAHDTAQAQAVRRAHLICLDGAPGVGTFGYAATARQLRSVRAVGCDVTVLVRNYRFKPADQPADGSAAGFVTPPGSYGRDFVTDTPSGPGGGSGSAAKAASAALPSAVRPRPSSALPVLRRSEKEYGRLMSPREQPWLMMSGRPSLLGQLGAKDLDFSDSSKKDTLGRKLATHDERRAGARKQRWLAQRLRGPTADLWEPINGESGQLADPTVRKTTCWDPRIASYRMISDEQRREAFEARREAREAIEAEAEAQRARMRAERARALEAQRQERAVAARVAAVAAEAADEVGAEVGAEAELAGVSHSAALAAAMAETAEAVHLGLDDANAGTDAVVASPGLARALDAAARAAHFAEDSLISPAAGGADGEGYEDDDTEAFIVEDEGSELGVGLALAGEDSKVPMPSAASLPPRPASAAPRVRVTAPSLTVGVPTSQVPTPPPKARRPASAAVHQPHRRTRPRSAGRVRPGFTHAVVVSPAPYPPFGRTAPSPTPPRRPQSAQTPRAAANAAAAAVAAQAASRGPPSLTVTLEPACPRNEVRFASLASNILGPLGEDDDEEEGDAGSPGATPPRKTKGWRMAMWRHVPGASIGETLYPSHRLPNGAEVFYYTKKNSTVPEIAVEWGTEVDLPDALADLWLQSSPQLPTVTDAVLTASELPPEIWEQMGVPSGDALALAELPPEAWLAPLPLGARVLPFGCVAGDVVLPGGSQLLAEVAPGGALGTPESPAAGAAAPSLLLDVNFEDSPFPGEDMEGNKLGGFVTDALPEAGVFAPRSIEAASATFVDTAETVEAAARADYARMAAGKAFRKFAKAALGRDVKGRPAKKAVVEASLDALEDAVLALLPAIEGAWTQYVGRGDPAVAGMSLEGWTALMTEAGVYDKKFGREETDKIFKTASKCIKRGAKTKKPKPQKALMKYQYLEGLVRVAYVRAREATGGKTPSSGRGRGDSGAASSEASPAIDLAGALSSLVNARLRAGGLTTPLEEPSNLFRTTLMYAEPVEKALRRNAVFLRCLFEAYAGRAYELGARPYPFKYFAGHYPTKLMVVAEWAAMLADVGFGAFMPISTGAGVMVHSAHVSAHRAQKSFSRSLMADASARERLMDEPAATFADFLEAISRLAKHLAMPSLDALREKAGVEAYDNDAADDEGLLLEYAAGPYRDVSYNPVDSDALATRVEATITLLRVALRRAKRCGDEAGLVTWLEAKGSSAIGV